MNFFRLLIGLVLCEGKVLAEDKIPVNKSASVFAGEGTEVTQEFIDEHNLKEGVHYESFEKAIREVTAKQVDENTVTINGATFVRETPKVDDAPDDINETLLKAKMDILSTRETSINTREEELTTKLANYKLSVEAYNTRVKEFNDKIANKVEEVQPEIAVEPVVPTEPEVVDTATTGTKTTGKAKTAIE